VPGVSFIKLTAIGIIIALIVGAFVVRVLLVALRTAQDSVSRSAGLPQ
jgi:hypothetical protein